MPAQSVNAMPVLRMPAFWWAWPVPRFLAMIWVRALPGQGGASTSGGKLLFPMADRVFQAEPRPLPLKWLICLEVDPDPWEGGYGRITAGLREGLEGPLLAALRGLEGTEIHKTGREWRIRYPRREGHGRIMGLLRQHPDACWKAWAQPDFSKEPVLSPIAPHEAAFFVLRELKQSLTRGGRPGALSPGALMSHLGGLLTGVACHRLTPGPRERRLALVRGLLEPD